MNKHQINKMFAGVLPAYRTCQKCGLKKYGMEMNQIDDCVNGNDFVSATSKCCDKPQYLWEQ